MVKHATFAADSEKPAGEHVDHHSIATTESRGKNSVYVGEGYQEDAKAVRKLLLKLDFTILPFAVLLYLSAYLDRGNLANARLQGLEETVLDGSDTNCGLPARTRC